MMTGAQWEWSKTFPILTPTIRPAPTRDPTREPRRTPESPALPWDMVQPHERQARINHGHGLEVLAQRGGLAWSEALAVLLDKAWERIEDAESRRQVLNLLAVWRIRTPTRRVVLLAA